MFELIVCAVVGIVITIYVLALESRNREQEKLIATLREGCAIRDQLLDKQRNLIQKLRINMFAVDIEADKDEEVTRTLH